jgi:hypothetical protein
MRLRHYQSNHIDRPISGSIFIGAESAAGVAVRVLMLKAEDPRATDAFEAAQVRLEAKK